MSTLEIAKSMGVTQNLTLRVLDQTTGKVVQSHTGHNSATNSLLFGLAHYLVGDSSIGESNYVKGSNSYVLNAYIPRYISLGTMGLYSQDEDENGLPAGIGVDPNPVDPDPEVYNFQKYAEQCPGYGADGYSPQENNGRAYFGLGPSFDTKTFDNTINCELISEVYPRSAVSFREIVPEYRSELPKTIDIVYSAMISTGALRSFREPDKDYIFITEAGLWSNKLYEESGENGLLAGYRIMPTDKNNWDMTVAENRELLKQNILRVGVNQVVQVIWKIQVGSIDQLVGGPPPEYEIGDNIQY